MLLELRICNLALAEEVTLRPGPGLTVLTGETGAGKSLIAGAFTLLAGGRSDRGMIRRGEELAWVEAVCDLSDRPDLLQVLSRLGVRLSVDGILVLRRELRREGRGRALINGELSSLAILEQLGSSLFSIQSQHQHRELTSPRFARDLLDDALGLGELRLSVAKALADMRAAQTALKRRRNEYELAREQEDIWRYQHEELSAAALSDGEEQELAEAIAVKQYAQQLQECAAVSLGQLDGEHGAARQALGTALAALRPHASRSHRLTAALESLETAAAHAAEASSELERFLDGFQTDPRGLSELLERKALYEQLRRKYHRDVPALLALKDQLGQRIGRQETAFQDLAGLESDLESHFRSLALLCRRLHESRREGAPAVAAAAEAAIRPLSLDSLELAFEIEPLVAGQELPDPQGGVLRIDASGPDAVRLLVRTNPGEAVGEVADIASGGELARIFLGLTMMRRQSERPLLRLFDEVDAGLGMDAATRVACLLAELAAESQALCITHLPTVAVYGRQHWLVSKSVQGGRTTLSLDEIQGQTRTAEIARQLGGEGWRRDDAAAQQTYARELLAAAGQNTDRQS